MGGLLKRIAPGIALAGTALAIVFGFDRALKPTAVAVASDDPNPTDVASSSCARATERKGDRIATEWGPVQVVARIGNDGTVCESAAVVYPDDRGRSIIINEFAVPIIDEEVANVGVEFDAVSGATVTSDGYRRSLQSILDSL